MEKEGLRRAAEFFEKEGVRIAELVTDRHPQILKYVREKMKRTKHSIDVWHVGKGRSKIVLIIISLKKNNCCTKVNNTYIIER